MVCFEIRTKVPLHSEYFHNLKYKKPKFTLLICNVIICSQKKTYEFELKLCFMLLYTMQYFAMINDNLIIS